MDLVSGSASVLGMDLNFFTRQLIETREISWAYRSFHVVKVEKSASGWKTSTGTQWTCWDCRERIREITEERFRSGMSVFEPATWKLTGEIFYSRDRGYLYLCSRHFKERRDQVREGTQSPEFGNYVSQGFELLKSGDSLEMSSEIETSGAPWK